MGSVSPEGWIIRTALSVGREFFEHFNEGAPHSERRSELEMRAIIKGRMNYLVRSIADPNDQAEDDEVVWTMRERDPRGSFKGSYLRFLAPDWDIIRRIRQQNVERARIARQALKERAEIRRATKAGSRAINSRSASNAGARVSAGFQIDDRHAGDMHDAQSGESMPTSKAPRRSGGMRL